MNPTLSTEEQDLQTRFQELPEEVMDVIVGGTLDAVMFGIQEEYKLTDDQIRLLENEIILVLTLFADRAEFTQNVQSALNIPADTAETIATEVNFEIFEMVEDFFEAVEQARAQNTVPSQDDATLAKKEELRALAQTFATPAPLSTTNTPTQNIPVSAEPQVQTDNVEPLRTMEGDINRIHGYGAFNQTGEGEEK